MISPVISSVTRYAISVLTQHDEPLRLLDTVRIWLWISESLPLGVLGLLDLILGTVSDEDWLSSPLDDDVLALWDSSEVDFNLGLSQYIGGGGHVDEEICEAKPSAICSRPIPAQVHPLSLSSSPNWWRYLPTLNSVLRSQCGHSTESADHEVLEQLWTSLATTAPVLLE